MDFDVSILETLGIDIQTGYDYTGGKDRYISALWRYYKSSDANKAKIREYIDNNDIENLAITVHAIKSNSKMIGAMALSEMFEKLEVASRDNDMDTVKASIDKTMEEYGKLVDALSPLGQMESLKASGELTAEEAKEVSDKLLLALDDFDDDLASELASKLAGYPFRITQKSKLREAAEYIRDFMYDEAAEIIKELYDHIE